MMLMKWRMTLVEATSPPLDLHAYTLFIEGQLNLSQSNCRVRNNTRDHRKTPNKQVPFTVLIKSKIGSAFAALAAFFFFYLCFLCLVFSTWRGRCWPFAIGCRWGDCRRSCFYLRVFLIVVFVVPHLTRFGVGGFTFCDEGFGGKRRSGSSCWDLL